MTKEDIRVGVTLRVVRARWESVAGTLAVVESLGAVGVPSEWCFTVRWHRPPPHKNALHRDTSLNLFESDLADFELFRGPPPRHQHSIWLASQKYHTGEPLPAVGVTLYRQ